MSLTFLGILGAVVGPFLLKAGFSDACSNEIITLAPALVGGVVAWIGRYRAGGVKWYGAKV